MTFGELADMIRVREHALALAMGPRKYSKLEEKLIRDFADRVDRLTVNMAVKNNDMSTVIEDDSKLRYGLVKKSKKASKRLQRRNRKL